MNASRSGADWLNRSLTPRFEPASCNDWTPMGTCVRSTRRQRASGLGAVTCDDPETAAIDMANLDAWGWPTCTNPTGGAS